jgi:acetyl/propionyl-CoA carboxylase alpha subunit
MPDDTRPYKAVFEEGRAEGNTLVGEIKENPEKDIPLGDEKRDFTKEIKETVDDVYPEKAHEAVDKLADQLVDTFNLLGEQLVAALKKAGMTDEQIEKAKYTTIGAAEIAKETAEKTAKNLRAVARVKSRKLQEEARQKASEMKEQAKEQMEELQKKKEEMRRQSEIRAEQAKLKSEKLKAQVRIQMQEAKVQADKLKEQVRTQAEIAQDKANELKEKVNARADDYRRNVSAAANRAKADILGYVDDFCTKTEERAAQIRAKDRNAKGGAIEGSEFSQETVGKSSEKTKK